MRMGALRRNRRASRNHSSALAGGADGPLATTGGPRCVANLRIESWRVFARWARGALGPAASPENLNWQQLTATTGFTGRAAHAPHRPRGLWGPIARTTPNDL